MRENNERGGIAGQSSPGEKIQNNNSRLYTQVRKNSQRLSAECFTRDRMWSYNCITNEMSKKSLSESVVLIYVWCVKLAWCVMARYGVVCVILPGPKWSLPDDQISIWPPRCRINVKLSHQALHCGDLSSTRSPPGLFLMRWMPSSAAFLKMAHHSWSDHRFVASSTFLANLAELGIAYSGTIPGSHPTWQTALTRSHGMAPCPNPALLTPVSLKAQY